MENIRMRIKFHLLLPSLVREGGPPQVVDESSSSLKQVIDMRLCGGYFGVRSRQILTFSEYCPPRLYFFRHVLYNGIIPKRRKMTLKMIRRSVAWAVLTALMLTAAVLPAAAVAPVYDASEAYMTSPYYTALSELTLSGDGRYDTLAVAFSQLGYHEGDSDADLGGANADGTRNFAEYNRLYGKLDNGEGNGTSYGYSWCAAFVSWCLRHGGVEESAAVTEVSCRRMTDWYREQGWFYRRASGYTPRPGDLIMFHEGNGTPTHVGLVVGTQGRMIRVIDGNGAEGAVALHEYRRGSHKIYGYCVPDYRSVSGTVYDFWPEGEHSDPPTASVAAVCAVLGVSAVIGVALACRRGRGRTRKKTD